MQVTVTGDADFKRFELACDKAVADFDKHMRHGLRQAAEDLGQAVLTASDIYMPSGYEELFRSRALAKVDDERPSLAVVVRVYARGRIGRREVRRMEQGILRHPVFGRTRVLKSGKVIANPWATTRIRRGFFSEPVKFATPRAFRRLDVALGNVIGEIERLA